MAGRQYTHAIVCRVPQEFCEKDKYEEAKQEHEALVRLLRDLNLDVIELPPDQNLPKCVYVEDIAVVVNGTALITRPGDTDRQKEVRKTRNID